MGASQAANPGSINPGPASDLEFLSQTATRFLELPPEADIYEAIAAGLGELAPSAVVILNSLDSKTKTVHVRKITGLGTTPGELLAALGRDPIGMSLKPTPEALQGLLTGRLHLVTGGLHELLFRTLPEAFTRRLEARMGVDAIYSMGFVWQGILYGDVVLIHRKGDPALRLPAIEAFVKQSAAALRRRMAEEALSAGEKRLRWLVEAAPDMIYRLRAAPAHGFEFVSAAAFELTGYPPQEFYDDPHLFERIITPEDRPAFELLRGGQGAIGEPVTLRWRRRDGALVWSEHRCVPLYDEDGQLSALEGIARDVTAAHRRQREMEAIIAISAALRGAAQRSEMTPILLEQLNAHFKVDAALVAIHDARTPGLLVDGALGAWAGLAGRRLPTGRAPLGQILRQPAPYLSAAPEPDPLKKGRATPRCYAIFPLVAQEQAIGVLAFGRAEAFEDDDRRVLSVMSDIAANAIRRSSLHEQTAYRLRNLTMLRNLYTAINASLDLKVVLDVFLEQLTGQIGIHAAAVLLLAPDQKALEYAACRGLNLHTTAPPAPSQGDGLAWRAIHARAVVALPDLAAIDIDWANNPLLAGEQFTSYYAVPLLAKGEIRGAVEIFHRESLVFDKEGLEFLETLASLVAIAIENAQLYQALQDKITTLARTQDQLVQREKVAALGELVAGVAHELNNPLTSIIGFAQLLRHSTLSAPHQQDLDKIIAQAQHAARIVRGLLDFSRQRPPEREPVQVNALIQDTLDLLAYELRAHNLACELDLAPGLPETLADPNQLQQVLLNLVTNAWQAVEETGRRGRLKIRTSARPPAGREDPGNGKVLRITIEDNGPGIPAENVSRLFNPFFTTKPRGQGTGLGLSICYGIISEHGGHIWVDREVKTGARFLIELPILAQGGARAATRRRSRPEVAAHATARILLLEDEHNLAEILVRALGRSGYEVDPVADGEAGLARLSEAHYDLIISDIHLDGMTGMEFQRRVARLDPALGRRTIFTTGDLIGAEIKDFLEETGCTCLVKPFELADLVGKVRELLSQPERDL